MHGSRARSRGCASASSPAPSARTRAADPEVERIACERLGLEPAPSSTQILQRDRHAEVLNALALLAASLERFATRDPASRPHRGARGRGAVRQRPEGLVGDAAQAQPDHLRADLRARARRARRRDRGPRERRAVARAGHLALLGRAGRPARRVPRRRLHARPLRLARRGARRPHRADAREPRREPPPLLQPAAPARARRLGPARATRPTGSSSATRCAPGTRASTSPSSCAPTPSSPAAVDLDAVFDLGAYTRHVDVVFERLRALREEHVHA